MRYTENEGYYTAGSTTTPLFFIFAVSWNETYDQPDYRAFQLHEPPNYTDRQTDRETHRHTDRQKWL